MAKTWKWRVCYSIKYTNGSIEEKGAIIEARILAEALAKAFVQIETPARQEKNVKDVRIWRVAIITGTDDPAAIFEEE